MHDDYSLALFKLGTACLESTRLSGLAREMSSVSTPLGTWLEISPDGQAHVSSPESRALQGQALPSSASSMNLGAKRYISSRTGLNREIRIIRIAREDTRSGASVLAGGARWSAAKTFLLTFVIMIINLVRLTSSKVARVLPFSSPPIPNSMRGLPRKVRLLWHGTSGEESRQRQKEERRRAQAAITELNSLRAKVETVEQLLGAPAVNDIIKAFERVEQDTEQARGNVQALAKLLPKLQRLRQHADGLLRAAGQSASPHPTRPLGTASAASGVRSAERVLLPEVPTALDRLWEALGADDAYDEAEDEDWEMDSDEGDGAETTESESEGGTPAPTMESIRSSRLRRLLSPGPAGEEISANYSAVILDEREDTIALVEAARRTFEEDDSRGASLRVADRGAVPPFQNVLMAHLTTPSGAGVLTRRRYERLFSGPSLDASSPQPDEEALRATIERRRRVPSPTEVDSARTTCVICLTEPRTVLLLPCRCVALCNGCREDLSSRPPTRIGNDAAAGFDTPHARRRGPPTHTCPTCRAPVEAFSRIFVP